MLERAAQADPQNSDALNGLGISYARAGRQAEAMKTFARILAQNPRERLRAREHRHRAASARQPGSGARSVHECAGE